MWGVTQAAPPPPFPLQGPAAALTHCSTATDPKAVARAPSVGGLIKKTPALRGTGNVKQEMTEEGGGKSTSDPHPPSPLKTQRVQR